MHTCVDSSPGAAVTNDHTLGGLKQFILSVWIPEVRNRGVSRSALPQEALREGPSCLFQLLGRGVGVAWLWLHPPTRDFLLFVCVTSLPPPYEGTCDGT